MIILMGGTFDPIHFGHLRSALELQQRLNAREVRWIPCGVPVHKSLPEATPRQRLDMLNLAVKPVPGFMVDNCEITKQSLSYTVETLRTLRSDLGNKVSLVWTLGSDAFQSFTSWNSWQEILSLTHLVVISRGGEPEKPLSPQLLLYVDPLANFDVLSDLPSGRICFIKLTPFHISSSLIRQQIRKELSPQFLLPDIVLEYIDQQKLYRK